MVCNHLLPQILGEFKLWYHLELFFTKFSNLTSQRNDAIWLLQPILAEIIYFPFS